MANTTGKTQVDDGVGMDTGAMVERARHGIEDAADRAKRTFDDLDQRLSTAVRERPLVVLGAALGVGYVLGRIFNRLR